MTRESFNKTKGTQKKMSGETQKKRKFTMEVHDAKDHTGTEVDETKIPDNEVITVAGTEIVMTAKSFRDIQRALLLQVDKCQWNDAKSKEFLEQCFIQDRIGYHDAERRENAGIFFELMMPLIQEMRKERLFTKRGAC